MIEFFWNTVKKYLFNLLHRIRYVNQKSFESVFLEV